MHRLTQGALIIVLLLTAAMPLCANDSPTKMQAEAISASLLLTPARCVALHQGQICYQRVQISWSSSALGNYCVYQQGQTEPLHCWQQQSEATLEIEFAADRSGVMQLKDDDQHVIAEAILEVAWVYKANTRRKTHWRLF